MEKNYADIIPGISHEQIDRTFQYRVPENLKNELEIGSVVKIPFGKSNRLIKGFVIGLSDKANYDETKLKEIECINTNINASESKMIRLALWMKEEYSSTMSGALKTVIPVQENVKQKKKTILKIKATQEEIEKYEETHKRATARLRLIKLLLDKDKIFFEKEKDTLKISKKIVEDLVKDNIITAETDISYRNPINEFYGIKNKKNTLPKLNEEQQSITEEIFSDMKEKITKTYLIYGITGSGKTRVYIEIIKKIVEEGKQAIVLIPEIALTFQTVSRFYNEFGDKVSIINSKMSKGEKYDQFERAKNGDISIMIGPRSALFTPFKNIGLIIIDEEQEESYKSELTPKYDAREVAIHIAKEEGASVIMGSATPSVSSFHKAKTGEYKMLRLTKRAVAESVANVEIVDMRKELREGNKTMFSRSMLEKISYRLAKKEQCMIFLNKRGFTGFISCRSCGHVIKCPHCDIAMTYHKGNKLVCHYCGTEEKMVKECPKCGSKYIAGMKAGTQQVEDKIKEFFPNARVIRMDRDTTQKKGGHEEILRKFADGEADILVGTQMIVKGHDYSNVTFVGVIAADLSLYLSDYRSNERTFQLLTQAAGRAGRGDKHGDVVIQTYSPDNYAIRYAAEQNYEGFYEEEMKFRMMMEYPPVYTMISVQMASTKEDELSEAVKELSCWLKSNEDNYKDKIRIIGPSKASSYKLEDRYYMILYIKASDENTAVGFKNEIENFFSTNKKFEKISIQYDKE